MLSVIRSAWYRLSDKAYTFWLRRQRGVRVGNVIVEGKPLIDLRHGGTLAIGEGVLIISRNWGYHVNMYGPVKLMADAPGAAITIGSRTRIYGSCIHASSRITIGADCLIAANCQILDVNGHELSFPSVEERARTRDRAKPIVIEDAVWLGAGTVILPGVRVGRGSVIGAGSVVTREIPPLSLAVGNPAKVVRRFPPEPLEG